VLPVKVLVYVSSFKGIFQPFELGGVTRLIRSAVKFWKAGNLKKIFNDTNSGEELKTN
jgi:hypothetical protein